METNTTNITYWFNTTTGEQLCPDHSGAYLTASITAKPKAKSHKTPLGTWKIVSAEDVAFFTAEYGNCCEQCAFGAK